MLKLNALAPVGNEPEKLPSPKAPTVGLMLKAVRALTIELGLAAKVPAVKSPKKVATPVTGALWTDVTASDAAASATTVEIVLNRMKISSR